MVANLMAWDNRIWAELGIKAGSQLLKSALLQQRYAARVSKTVAGMVPQIDRAVLEGLEDENFHSMVTVLRRVTRIY